MFQTRKFSKEFLKTNEDDLENSDHLHSLGDDDSTADDREDVVCNSDTLAVSNNGVHSKEKCKSGRPNTDRTPSALSKGNYMFNSGCSNSSFLLVSRAANPADVESFLSGLGYDVMNVFSLQSPTIMVEVGSKDVASLVQSDVTLSTDGRPIGFLRVEGQPSALETLSVGETSDNLIVTSVTDIDLVSSKQAVDRHIHTKALNCSQP